MNKIINEFRGNKITLAFVFVWFTLIPFVALSILNFIFKFGFLTEFPAIIIMEMFMFILFALVHKKIPAIKNEIMCNDKDVVEGSYDFRGYKGEGE